MRRSILVLFLLLILMNLHAQNLVSPIWRIHTNVDAFDVKDESVKDWSEVNLLLSWERQGYSWADTKVCLENTFEVKTIEASYILRFSLQCNVDEILINGARVTSGITNSFWSERGKQTVINIPDSIISIGINEIKLQLSELSYTGGISHNNFEILSDESIDPSNLIINIPKDDHVFLSNDKKTLTIEHTSPMEGAVILEINNDFHENIVTKRIKVEKGTSITEFDLQQFNLEPGFYECTGVLENGFYTGDAQWFAIEPEKVKCNAVSPEQFDKYWIEAKNELGRVSPNFKWQKVDSLCSATRDGFVVEMQSLGDLTIRAYYFVPKSENKHPVVLHLPGYSYGFDYLDDFINRESVVAELALCIRGHGISADIFNPWAEQTLWSVNICDEKNQIYRAIYMDCIRAVEFLKSRPEIDDDKIGVVGGSQGGGLAIATAGLMKDDIAACAFFDPFLSDIREHAEIRKIINGEFEMFLQHENNPCNMEQLLNNQDLIDVSGFASKIACPVYFEAALFDDDCPVHIGFAVYNKIKSKKSYKVYPNDSHLGESGQYGNLFYFIEGEFTHK